MHSPTPAIPAFAPLLAKAVERRRTLINARRTQAFRVFSGIADGVDGIFVDVYGPGAVLIDYEGATPRWFQPPREAAAALDVLAPLGVTAIYHKPFAKDRSRLGGQLPECVTQATPLAGTTLDEAILIREHDWNLEIRLYDGLSTGLFLDQRDNRRFIASRVAQLLSQRPGVVPSVLNTFAYTCAFSVAAAIAGATTTSVDVSPRYLDWGKRNFAHNNIDPETQRFARLDTMDFLQYARKKGLRYDIIVLDPPSFASGNKRKNIRPWSSVTDYAPLVRDAAAVLNPRGLIFASTNTQELCRPGRLEREIIKGLGRTPQWVKLPDPPTDFAREQDRFAALAFTVA
jgi:23S rRNA (cytosine1962-C5)-methyltransferase